MKKYRDFLILIILTMGSQATIYFLIKCFISDYNVITSIINFPFIKQFVYFYDSWYPFIILVAFIIFKHDSKQFNLLIATMLITALLGQITFIIYPSMIIRPEIEVNNITDWILDFTYKADTPAINCLPSMHCIYCFITSYYIATTKNINIKSKILILTYSLLIVFSTLFIKQHVVEDVILALIYTVIGILIVAKYEEKINKLINKITKTQKKK